MVGGVQSHTAKGLHHEVIACAFDKDRGRNIGASALIDIHAAINAVIIEDHHANRQVVATNGLDLHATEAKGTVALNGEHGFLGGDGRGNGKAHTDSHDAPRSHIQAFSGLIHVDNTSGKVQCVGPLIDQGDIGVMGHNAPHHCQSAVEIHRAWVQGQGIGHFAQVFCFALSNACDPLFRGGCPVRSHPLKHRLDTRADVSNQRGGDGHIAVDLFGLDVDLNELFRA